MLRASFMPCTLVSFLMLRVLMRATRSSMPTWSMVGLVRELGTEGAGDFVAVAMVRWPKIDGVRCWIGSGL